MCFSFTTRKFINFIFPHFFPFLSSTTPAIYLYLILPPHKIEQGVKIIFITTFWDRETLHYLGGGFYVTVVVAIVASI